MILRNKKGIAAPLEYAVLIMFIIGALLVFQVYIARGFIGRWKQAGDAFGHGAQYDPKDFGTDGSGGGTLECKKVSGLWVDKKYFDENCDCTLEPTDPQYAALCTACTVSASTTPEAAFCK